MYVFCINDSLFKGFYHVNDSLFIFKNTLVREVPWFVTTDKNLEKSFNNCQ